MSTVFYNGKVYIERGTFAQAVLVSDGVISAVGTDAEVLPMAGDAQRIDLAGRTLIPGFNDSHLHLLNLGNSLQMVRLGDVTSMDELIARGREFIEEMAPPAGSVVLGRGWNQDYFTDGAVMPTRHELDEISTDHPLIFTRACGHVCTCNTKALELAGVTGATPQVEGGQFDLDENGQPNGIFREHAKNLLMSLQTAENAEGIVSKYKAAQAYANSCGITTVQTNDISGENYALLLDCVNRLDQTGELTVRMYHQCCIMDPAQLQAFFDAGYTTGVGTDMNRVGPLKLFADGSLGARTALMRNDYADEPGTRGIATLTQGQADALVEMAAAHNMTVTTHCIGDAAIELMLNSYDRVIEGGNNVLRHGIVHCQITDTPLIDRFVENDILAQVQPIFIHYDMHVVSDRVGEELASTSYAFGTMVRRGIHVSYGTDCPVEDLNTFNNLYCAVTRKDLRGGPEGGWHPEEKVDIYTAIDNYTAESAYACFEEGHKGRIRPGYLADLVVLDQDIFTVPDDEIRNVRADMTVVGGRIVYTREA